MALKQLGWITEASDPRGLMRRHLAPGATGSPYVRTCAKICVNCAKIGVGAHPGPLNMGLTRGNAVGRVGLEPTTQGL